MRLQSAGHDWVTFTFRWLSIQLGILCCCYCWIASVVSNSVWPHRRQPPGSAVPGILHARTLERVAIAFSNAWKWKVKVKSLSCVRLLATPWAAAYQVPPPMGFPRQEYWSGVPLPSLGILCFYISVPGFQTGSVAMLLWNKECNNLHKSLSVSFSSYQFVTYYF